MSTDQKPLYTVVFSVDGVTEIQMKEMMYQIEDVFGGLEAVSETEDGFEADFEQDSEFKARKLLATGKRLFRVNGYESHNGHATEWSPDGSTRQLFSMCEIGDGESSRVDPLQNSGRYEILTPESWIEIIPQIIEEAGRTCYQSARKDKDTGQDLPITAESAAEFVAMLITRTHESQLEHGAITVRFDLHSRGFTHELVRHRLCAFGQESTRYVDYALDEHAMQVVLPPCADGKTKDKFIEAFEAAAAAYLDLRSRPIRASGATSSTCGPRARLTGKSAARCADS